MPPPSTGAALLRARASHHRSAGPVFASPEDVVSHFGCVQSQDFAMAKWAIGRRVGGLTDQQLDSGLASGRFQRTHILRPTWHFVRAEDLAWIMGLTAPRVHRLLATFNKTISLHDPEIEAAADIIVKALTIEQPQTRAELAGHLIEAGIDAHGTRLAHLVMWAELQLLICNGPLAGKLHTYVLTPPSALAGPQLTYDEALERLARTYVRGHGPSQPADLSWWSSLTLTQSRKAFELADLRPITIDGTGYWTDDTDFEVDPPVAALVPAFDESISYATKPVDQIRFPGSYPDLARGGGLLFIGDVIGGTWSRKVSTKTVSIAVDGYGTLSSVQRRAIESDAAHFGSFLGLEHTLRFIE